MVEYSMFALFSTASQASLGENAYLCNFYTRKHKLHISWGLCQRQQMHIVLLSLTIGLSVNSDSVACSYINAYKSVRYSCIEPDLQLHECWKRGQRLMLWHVRHQHDNTYLICWVERGTAAKPCPMTWGWLIAWHYTEGQQGQKHDTYHQHFVQMRKLCMAKTKHAAISMFCLCNKLFST